MTHLAPQVRATAALASAALVLLLAATSFLLLLSGEGLSISSLVAGSHTTATLVRRGPLPSAAATAQQLTAVATGRRPAAQPEPPSCELDLTQGPIAENCTSLQDVCVDQVRECATAVVDRLCWRLWHASRRSG